MDPTLVAAASDPTVTFDLVHAQLSLKEILDIVQQGIVAFQYGLELFHRAYCALPFIKSC